MEGNGQADRLACYGLTDPGKVGKAAACRRHCLLGLHTIGEICGNWKGSSLVELRAHVENVYRRAARAASAT